MAKIMAEYVDRLINIEMRQMGGLPRGVTHALYEAARKFHKEPLTYLAASGLIEAVKPKDHVIIATGAGVAPWLPKGETDGPLGAAALARTIDLGLGGKPVLVGEARCLPPIAATVEAAGLLVADDELFGQRDHVAQVREYPLGEARGEAFASELLEKYNPKAIITVEKHGPSASGKYHSIMGVGRSPESVANVKFLVEAAMAKGILTIGIGDGGNEIGFGNIHEDVRRIQKFGSKCQCPCGAGIATVTKADVLVAAAISNWGAYGIAAMLAFMLKNPRLLHDKDTEYRMLEASIRAGAMDGLYTNLSMYVDGTSCETQLSLITMLHEIVTNGLSEQPRHW
ncbi:hypothetical protein SDC9_16255 [bioreactor metagenome]|uniref:D-glutamate cyclase-like C-terminal domain-containing protein n=1 Tax=bioreactor metagenome TaxID=1076179 RepID=A0A644TV11_9ZZZZ|nr:conserved hypothetical protein [uncultured Spirochaetota bacterium]HOI23020.1 DUF4392 domain-containing protein [Spirochaetales bacterium]